MGKERDSRHVSSPEGLFLCHLITWAKKVSFCLSPPELGISHLHPQASQLLQHPHQSITPHHLLCQPAARSRKQPPPATKAPSQSITSPSASLPRPCPISHHKKVSFGPLGSQGLVVPLRQVAYCRLQRGRKRKAGGHSAEGKRELPTTSWLTACNYDTENAL